MNTIIQKVSLIKSWKSIFIDLSALLFIYLIPTFSHLLQFPLYFIEPMRLMLILALAHTNKQNAYFIAISLPLFSFLISGHPIVAKMVLISMELSLNVFLFYLLKERIKNIFPALFLSIIISKSAYYLLKYFLISFAILQMGLISTPILIQFTTSIAFSGYVYFLLKNPKNKV